MWISLRGKMLKKGIRNKQGLKDWTINNTFMFP